MDIGEMGQEVVDKFHLHQDRDQWRALVCMMLSGSGFEVFMAE